MKPPPVLLGQSHPQQEGSKGHPYNEKRSNYYINSTGCSSTSIIHYCEKFSTGRQTRQQFAPTRLCSSFHATRHCDQTVAPARRQFALQHSRVSHSRYNNAMRSLLGVIKPRPITHDTWPTVPSITMQLLREFIRTIIGARWHRRRKVETNSDRILAYFYTVLYYQLFIVSYSLRTGYMVEMGNDSTNARNKYVEYA